MASFSGVGLAGDHAVASCGHVEILEQRPQRFVPRVVHALKLAEVVGWKERTDQSVLAGALDLSHGVVEIAQEDLREAGTPPRQRPAEVSEPSVMRAQSCEPEFVLASIS